LRGLAGHHTDFWQVTADALDFAMTTLDIVDANLRDRLMHLYLGLLAYPEVPENVAAPESGRQKLAILSNGTPAMRASAVHNAGPEQVFNAVLSVEEAGVFKPHPWVYQFAVERFNVAPEKICFLSSNGWDAFSAKAFGFRVLWCNRFGQVPERIPALPDGEIVDLARSSELFKN
jgi:2-haloacid dehalogenase